MFKLQPQHSMYDIACQAEQVGRVTVVCSEHQLNWIHDIEFAGVEFVITTAADCNKYNLKRIPSILFHEHGFITSGIKLSTAIRDLEKILLRKAKYNKR
ncbi:hypothetical protein ACQKPX_01860 [Photobacterium sp. DNB23_23_1]|uniref:Thioredoxin domain-containing protein n=1 Tax=Photobacterium pectinilyticum TaxID=2906793 RepID=A0ABT1N4D2_9GAMM|nr:hypothetical protein [Photobacterium sp. ZSDE20]MCQ1058104.1 hypothetical protein [Photobacterium sp. ZSDE20]MDD1822637.1 hypothetical protein [Photobacterium sp. ZSDE20]